MTDWALTQFQTHYRNPTIEKSAIFAYVYAVLHHPDYLQTYALNLKADSRVFRSIPTSASGSPGPGLDRPSCRICHGRAVAVTARGATALAPHDRSATASESR